MATRKYINANLVEITLTGALGDLSRSHVSGHLAGPSGLTQTVFNGAEAPLSAPDYEQPISTWMPAREAAVAAHDGEWATITLTNAEFRIPQSVIDASGQTVDDYETQLTAWVNGLTEEPAYSVTVTEDVMYPAA
jgi:hypothetical protein